MNYQQQTGFIAQEVEDAIGNTPFMHIIHENEDEYKLLDYTRMITILWATVRKQNERIELLENLINSNKPKVKAKSKSP
jgi:hypothetical protein